MSHTVVFENSKETIKFPTLAIANTYAKNVKNAKVLPGGTDDKFAIRKLGSRAEEEAKRALARKNANEIRISTLDLVSQAEEEHADILPSEEPETEKTHNICQCGRLCGKYTACYMCRRYS